MPQMTFIDLDPDEDAELLADLTNEEKTQANQLVLSAPSYFTRATWTMAGLTKQGVVTYIGILGGCIAVSTVAPRLAAVAVNYFISAQGVSMAHPMTPIVSASVVASTYTVGNKITAFTTEAALDTTGYALTYMYRGLGGFKQLEDQPDNKVKHSSKPALSA
jgi:hypothetical protein